MRPMNTEYALTQDEAGYWHIVDINTSESWETCETDVEEAQRALVQHQIYYKPNTNTGD